MVRTLRSRLFRLGLVIGTLCAVAAVLGADRKWH